MYFVYELIFRIPHSETNIQYITNLNWEPSKSLSYGSWIYNYLRNQCLSLLVSLNPAHGEVYSIQHCVIKYVCNLRQVCNYDFTRRDASQ